MSVAFIVLVRCREQNSTISPLNLSVNKLPPGVTLKTLRFNYRMYLYIPYISYIKYYSPVHLRSESTLIIIIIIIIIIINCKWVSTRWQWYYNTQYNTKKHKILHTHSKQYTTQ
jgi:hypothetical protein